MPPLDPETKRRPPRTILIWLVGVYVAFFSISAARYENRVDVIENRANAIYAQLAMPASHSALSRISRIQNMLCPLRPEITNPVSVFRSLFGKARLYDEMIEQLKETIENHKTDLDLVDLSYAHLQGANLSEAHLKGAILIGANLQEAILASADLQNAVLDNADLRGAVIFDTNFKDASLLGADLRKAYARPDASSYVTTIAGSGSVTYRSPLLNEVEERLKNKDSSMSLPMLALMVDDLCKSKTLYTAKLDPIVKKKVAAKNPSLLKSPFPAIPTLSFTK